MSFKNKAGLTCGAKQTNQTLNADLFVGQGTSKDIKNMKIFDENNDEGMPVHWDDKLKPHKLTPSIYDGLHSATIRPELHPDETSNEFFNRRNRKRLFSVSRKQSSDKGRLGDSFSNLPGKINVQ